MRSRIGLFSSANYADWSGAEQYRWNNGGMFITLVTDDSKTQV